VVRTDLSVAFLAPQGILTVQDKKKCVRTFFIFGSLLHNITTEKLNYPVAKSLDYKDVIFFTDSLAMRKRGMDCYKLSKK
jgi:hypothetical protein